MREAVVSADVDISRLDSCVSRIQARPVSAEMRQVPLFVNEAVLLLFGHFIIGKFGSNAKIKNERVFFVSVIPVESLLELSAGSRNTVHGEVSRRWRWMKPTLFFSSKWIKEIVGIVDPLTHGFGQSWRAVGGNDDSLSLSACYFVEGYFWYR
jgi:hypothetical protein